MRRPRRRPARELRAAIDAMPVETRRAMLDAIGRNPIIVGAYAARDGGVCPMLAAHRNGGRTDYAPFARAWDRYARAGRRARPATDGELTALRTMLEASIAGEDVRGRGALARAIREHRRSLWARARREEHEVDPYDLGIDVAAVAAAAPRDDAGAPTGHASAATGDPGAPTGDPGDYTVSPGRTNWISGTRQRGEVLSR